MRKHKPIEVGTAGIVGIAIFLLAGNVVERVSGTGPKSGAPPARRITLPTGRVQR
jgi:hypothetical protein